MSAQAMQSVDEFRARLEARHQQEGYAKGEIMPVTTEITPNKHLEYDIVHKDGTTEHCYQIMEGHSIQCH
jgi:hypothetical protein